MGRKYYVLSIKGFLFLFLPLILTTSPLIPVAEGHLFGQPPFFKVNSKYSNLYPVPVSSLYNFDLPQDLAPENYLAGKPVNFEFNKSRLPAPPDVIAKTSFDWDFTDGTHSQGLSMSHSFTNPGSYIIKIYADDGTTPKPQLLESVLVNILPDPNYNLPKSRILVNGIESRDPISDVLKMDFRKPISLDGSKSTSSNSITEYFWDFGDQKSSFGQTQTHKYPDSLSQAFVVLRIKDQKGFLADNFVEIQNSQNGQNSLPAPGTKPASPPKKSSLNITIIVAIIFILTLVMARLFVPGRRRGKHQ